MKRNNYQITHKIMSINKNINEYNNLFIKNNNRLKEICVNKNKFL